MIGGKSMTEELIVRLAESSIINLPPVRCNEEEVAAALDEMLSAYRGRQYTPEDIKSAKADRAAVNRIEKQLSDAQKAVNDLYKKPVEEFTAKMRLYREKAKEVSDAINVQVRAVEQAQRDEKKAQLEQVYHENAGGEIEALIPFDRLLDKSWLNASLPFGTAKKELMAQVETCRKELDILREMCGEDFPQIERVYLESLSIHSAVDAHHKLLDMRKAQAAAEAARRQEQAEKAAAPIIIPPTDEQREARAEGARRAEINQAITTDGRLDFSAERAAQKKPYDFRVWANDTDIEAIKELFAARGIQYGRVPKD